MKRGRRNENFIDGTEYVLRYTAGSRMGMRFITWLSALMSKDIDTLKMDMASQITNIRTRS